jgi:hypothetical protein
MLLFPVDRPVGPVDRLPDPRVGQRENANPPASHSDRSAVSSMRRPSWAARALASRREALSCRAPVASKYRSPRLSCDKCESLNSSSGNSVRPRHPRSRNPVRSWASRAMRSSAMVSPSKRDPTRTRLPSTCACTPGRCCFESDGSLVGPCAGQGMRGVICPTRGNERSSPLPTDRIGQQDRLREKSKFARRFNACAAVENRRNKSA